MKSSKNTVHRYEVIFKRFTPFFLRNTQHVWAASREQARYRVAKELATRRDGRDEWIDQACLWLALRSIQWCYRRDC